MLVLSRHRDETVCIGSSVKVTVLEIRGDKVRLGIEADNELPVHRQEVFDAIARQTPDYADRVERAEYERLKAKYGEKP